VKLGVAPLSIPISIIQKLNLSLENIDFVKSFYQAIIKRDDNTDWNLSASYYRNDPLPATIMVVHALISLFL
jgi:hypothetical protein